MLFNKYKEYCGKEDYQPIIINDNCTKDNFSDVNIVEAMKIIKTNKALGWSTIPHIIC